MSTATKTNGTDQIIRVNGRNIRYRELNKGASRPLVMFNGTALNYECWKPLSKKLNRHMVMIDLPGIGGSDLHDRPPSMDKYAEDMAFVLASLWEKDGEVPSFDLMGYSFGGCLAQAFVEKYPDLVNRLVLLSTTPGFSGAIPSYKAVMMSMTFTKAVLGRLFGRGSPEGDIVNNFRLPHALGPMYSTGALVLWSKKERKFNDTHETYIVHGTRDTLLPVKNALALKTLYEDSWLDVIPDGNHLVPLTHSDYVAKNINMFLGD